MNPPRFILVALAMLVATSACLLPAATPTAPVPAAAAQTDAPKAPAAAPLRLSVALDRPEYMHGEPGVRYLIAPTGTMRPILTVKNTSASPVTLSFSSTQQYDFIIRDAKGAEVRRWSEGHGFGQVLQSLSVPAGADKTFSAQVPLGGVGHPLPTGSYTLEAVLTASPRQSATAAFRIVPTPP